MAYEQSSALVQQIETAVANTRTTEDKSGNQRRSVSQRNRRSELAATAVYDPNLAGIQPRRLVRIIPLDGFNKHYVLRHLQTQGVEETLVT